jgi:hypothetical protein
LEVTGAVTLGSGSGDIILGNSSSTINIGTSGGTITIGNEDKKNTTLYGSATNIQNGEAGNLLYQSGPGTTAFVTSTSHTGDILTYDTNNKKPIWTTPQALTFTGLTTEGTTTTSSFYDTSTSPLNIAIGEGLTGTKTEKSDKDFTLKVTAATNTALGGVKSVTTGTATNRDYNVQVNTDGTMKVNVPWTDTNTTYTGGTGIVISGMEISSSYSWYIVDPSFYNNKTGDIILNGGPCYTVLVNTNTYPEIRHFLGYLPARTGYNFFGYAINTVATKVLTSWPSSGTKIYTLYTPS